MSSNCPIIHRKYSKGQIAVSCLMDGEE
uniref:Uncharacterized protein n=1 Tax=Anguilla anguilla TaxID=7936 RepID=A0A0E9QTE8_ANGAN